HGIERGDRVVGERWRRRPQHNESREVAHALALLEPLHLRVHVLVVLAARRAAHALDRARHDVLVMRPSVLEAVRVPGGEPNDEYEDDLYHGEHPDGNGLLRDAPRQRSVTGRPP